MHSARSTCYNDTSCDCFYITDAYMNNTTFEYDNRFSEITGYNSLSETAGRDIENIIHPDDLGRFRRKKISVSENNPFESLDMRLIKKDRTILYVRCNLIHTVTEDKYDRVVHAFSIIGDQERVNHHTEMASSEPIMFKFRTDEKFPFFFNESFLDAVGYTENEINSCPPEYSEIIHPDDNGHFMHALNSSVKSGTVSACTFRIISRQGEIRWINCSFKLMNSSAGKPYFLAVGKDITVQKKEETESRRNSILMHNLTENISCASFVLNETEDRASILRFSEGFRKMFGYDDETIKKHSDDICRLIIYPDDRNTFIHALMRTDEASENICRAVTESGRIIWIRFRSANTSEAHQPSFTCTFEDITHLRSLETELDSYRKALAESVSYNSGISFTVDFSEDKLVFHEVFTGKYNLPSVIYNMPENLIQTGLIHDEFREELTSLYYKVRNGSSEECCTLKLTMPDNRKKWVRLTLSAVYGATGKAEKGLGLITDISEQIIAADSSANNENSLFSCIINLSQCRVLRCTNSEKLLISIPEQMYYNSDFISSFISSVYPEDRTNVSELISLQNLWTNFINGNTCTSFEYRIMQENGNPLKAKAELKYSRYDITDDIIVTVSVSELPCLKGHSHKKKVPVPNTVLPARILTESPFRKLVNEQLKKQTASDCLQALYLLNLNGFDEVNKQYGFEFGDRILHAVSEELLGINRSAIIGKLYGDEFIVFIRDITSYDDLNITAKQLCGICKTIKIPGFEADSMTGCVGVSFAPLHGTDYETLYRKADAALYSAKRFDKTRYAIFSSVEASDSGTEFHMQNKPDSSLRLSYEDFRKNAALLVKSTGNIYHLYNADIKHFRNINHFYGYEKGDQILSEVCRSLTEFLNPGECFTRIFADNFLILTEVQCEGSVNQRTEEIIARMAALPLADEHRILFSAGYVTIDDTNRYAEFERLIDCAVAAHEHARKNETTSFVRFEPGMSDSKMHSFEVLSELKNAVKNGEICTFVQPQFDILKREYVSMEALVRWNHPVKGLLTPDKFIDICEKNGFISSIDFCVLEQMCSYIRNRLDQNLRVLPVAVNQSQITIHERGYLKRITSLIEKYRIPPEYIELEITESAWVDNFDETVSVLTALKEYGFRISMDDFGTGYSALNVLKDVPVDALKIDRAFLTENLVEKKPTEIIKSIANMAHNINLKVVCEGVEYPQQLSFLRKIGCELVQGYLFGKPMPYDEIEEFIDGSDNICIDP